MYRERWQVVPPASYIWYLHGPLTSALQSEHGIPLCELQVQYEFTQNGHAATPEPRHNQRKLMCGMALSCDSEQLDTSVLVREGIVAT